jgi:mono/diheme cytochrome c family protein
MKSLGWFLLGAISLSAIAFGLVFFNSHGFSANEKPGALETWFARRVRSAAVPSDARSRANPVAESPEVLADARAHWADHCAGCHANDGSGKTAMGAKTYPPAPDMRLPETQQMTDGELFYIIQNGIRFSAMPAWSSGSSHPEHDEEDSWKLVRFIRHLPNMNADEKHQMEGMNPKTPDELREEQEEEEFLKGAEPHEQKTEHHHH